MNPPMGNPTYAYGLIILPPLDLYRELLRIRDRHPLLRTKTPPHITVKSPFLFRHSGAYVVDQLREILARWVPFRIRVGGLGVFKGSILYARVAESPDLQELHTDLVNGLEGFVETLTTQYDGHGYTPHLTLADRLTPDDLSEARRILQEYRIGRSFWVEEVHLLKGRGNWEIARSFALGA
jgi:2'-5' RNA ligase